MASEAWTDYALLVPTVPKLDKKGNPVQWKVQINTDGKFRCNCPSYIFSKERPKSCKHMKKAESTRLEELKTGVPWVNKVVASEQPNLVEATLILKAMLDDAKVEVRKTIHGMGSMSTQQVKGGVVAQAAHDKMLQVLAQRLAVFVPASVPVTTIGEEIGLRRITFDDD